LRLVHVVPPRLFRSNGARPVCQLCLENETRNGRERNLWIEAKAVDKVPKLADFAALSSGVRATGC